MSEGQGVNNMWNGFWVCYLLIMSFILYSLYMAYKDYRKYSKGINNRTYSKDGNGIHITYVYSIPHTKERVMEILSLKNVQDRLPYEFDEKAMEIGFKEPQSEFQHQAFISLRYRMHFEAKEDFCLLYLEQINLIYPRTSVPMLLNEFWSIKVDAVPYESHRIKEQTDR